MQLSIHKLDVHLQLTIHLQLSIHKLDVHLQLTIHLQLSIHKLNVHLQLTIHLQLSIRMLDVHLTEELQLSASRLLLPFGGGFLFLSLMLGTEKTCVGRLELLVRVVDVARFGLLAQR